MKAIRDKFINKLIGTTTDAIGAYCILQFGINSHQPIAAQAPAATLHVGAGDPGVPGVRAVKYTPTHDQTQKKLSNHREIILELYLSQIVQEWFYFLAEVYEKAIDENLNNSAGYPIPHAKIKIDLSLSSVQLNQQIKESACKDFDFLNAKDKLKTIEKILSKNLLSFVSQKKLLLVNIKVRNILQHAAGMVSADDLADLGVASITEDHGDKTVTIGAGQRVSRTAFDIENFTNALIDIAKALIP